MYGGWLAVGWDFHLRKKFFCCHELLDRHERNILFLAATNLLESTR